MPRLHTWAFYPKCTYVLRELGPILSQVLIPEHVISSGYAGSKFGEQLLKGKANFTIIDQRNFMHDNIHATRAAVIPGRFLTTNIFIHEIIFQGVNGEIDRTC